MGLSASQTRFLCLTARQTNVEFQGQQVNQARTALANQSADLYSQLNQLRPPTTPSMYTYILNPPTFPKFDWSNPTAFPADQTSMDNMYLYYAGSAPTFTDFNMPLYDEESGKAEPNKPYCTYKTGYDSSGSKVQFLAPVVDENANYTWDSETGIFAAKNGTDELPAYVQAYNYAMSAWKTFSNVKSSAIYDIKPTDENMKADEPSDRPQQIASGFSKTVDKNQAQYSAAMVLYEADSQEYELALDQINAKIEEIHQSDKTLELQLKQLDTEQQAIQTEMDAVKKVIDKNIEQTFKTFA
ncbi:MAG: hypothetical protein PHX18_01090 [Candidatus Gastranaerophilales bacterium]|nr:hypothetical protein [Candidatus Gastranaerophilales bacterium]